MQPPTLAGYSAGNIVGGRYRIEVVLAQRSSSVVCLARDVTQTNLTVLIQSLPDRELAHRVQLLRRLFMNAQIVDVLRRDDLVQIVDFNVEPRSGTLFLVMAHRADQPAEQLAAPGGLESKTAAAFVEMARGLLDAHDSEFFERSDIETNPGVHLSDLPRQRGPGSGMYQALPAQPAAPRSSVRELPRAEAPPPTAPSEPIHGREAGAWREAGAPHARAPAPERRGKTRLTRTHVAVVTAITAVLGLGLIIITYDRPMYYGPDQIRRGEWQDYYSGDRNDYDGPGLLDRAESRSQITIMSNPPGARVYSGYKQIGSTPVQLDRPNNRQQLLLRLSKPGYTDQSVVVSGGSPSLLTVMMSRSLTNSAVRSGDDDAESSARTNPGSLTDFGRLPTYRVGEERKRDRMPDDGFDTSLRSDRKTESDF